MISPDLSSNENIDDIDALTPVPVDNTNPGMIGTGGGYSIPRPYETDNYQPPEYIGISTGGACFKQIQIPSGFVYHKMTFKFNSSGTSNIKHETAVLSKNNSFVTQSFDYSDGWFDYYFDVNTHGIMYALKSVILLILRYTYKDNNNITKVYNLYFKIDLRYINYKNINNNIDNECNIIRFKNDNNYINFPADIISGTDYKYDYANTYLEQLFKYLYINSSSKNTNLTYNFKTICYNSNNPYIELLYIHNITDNYIYNFIEQTVIDNYEEYDPKPTYSFNNITDTDIAADYVIVQDIFPRDDNTTNTTRCTIIGICNLIDAIDDYEDTWQFDNYYTLFQINTKEKWEDEWDEDYKPYYNADDTNHEHDLHLDNFKETFGYSNLNNDEQEFFRNFFILNIEPTSSNWNTYKYNTSISWNERFAWPGEWSTSTNSQNNWHAKRIKYYLKYYSSINNSVLVGNKDVYNVTSFYKSNIIDSISSTIISYFEMTNSEKYNSHNIYNISKKNNKYDIWQNYASINSINEADKDFIWCHKTAGNYMHEPFTLIGGSAGLFKKNKILLKIKK